MSEEQQASRGWRIVFRLLAIPTAFLIAVVLLEGVLRVHDVVWRAEPEWKPEAIAPGNPTPLDLRGPHYAFEAGQYRVLILGDSFMWGDQVDAAADIFPVRLAIELTERLGKPVGAVSLAQRGFTALASARA